MTKWPQIWQRCQNSRMACHPGQDCKISPIRHGLYGQDGYDHRDGEIEDAGSIRAMGTSEKRKEDQPSSSSGKRQKTSIPRLSKGWGRGYQGQDQTRTTSQSGQVICCFFH